MCPGLAPAGEPATEMLNWTGPASNCAGLPADKTAADMTTGARKRRQSARMTSSFRRQSREALVAAYPHDQLIVILTIKAKVLNVNRTLSYALQHVRSRARAAEPHRRPGDPDGARGIAPGAGHRARQQAIPWAARAAGWIRAARRRPAEGGQPGTQGGD